MYLGITPIANTSANYKLNFTGIKLPGVFKPDIFESKFDAEISDKIFQDFINTIYEKIERNLMAFTPEKLENAIQNLLKEVPETNEKEVLTVMQRLTQWASYSCFPRLSKMLDEKGIRSIHKNGGINNDFEYFKTKKRLIKTSSQNPYKLYLITKSTIHNGLKTLEPNTKFINLDGFDDGINIYNDDNLLQEKTKTVLLRLKELMNKNPKLSFEEALDACLNRKITKAMKTLGLEFEALRVDAPPTRKTILKQMAPCAPESKEHIKVTIETAAHHFAKGDKQYMIMRNNMADFFESKLDVYSKQRILENLKVIKSQIDEYMQSNKLSAKNMYLIISDECGTNKSYGLITRMFARQNNIADNKILTVENVMALNKYPANSTFIVLDDLVGSGDSFTKVGEYSTYGWQLGKDKHILFCPIVAHSQGIDTVKDAICFAKRDSVDEILTIKANIKERLMSKREVQRDEYFRYDSRGLDAYGYEGFEGGEECLVFPYTTPDNNADMASFITKYFLPDSDAISSKHLAFENIEIAIRKKLKF